MRILTITTQIALALMLGSIGSKARSEAYNDHMFPPAPIAQSAIHYDSRGFLIHGKRTFLVSASMEYARVPRALWHDRLLRLKRGGFNCIETYTFWNFHEPHEGKFDFSGDHDLDAYLKLIHKMGMYAIVRVGPYCCAEWDSGGYPIWLRFKPGVRVREDNKPFELAMDKFFDKLLPIVAANQIHKGGSVILVQLENEYPLGWMHTPSQGYGTDISSAYFQNMHDKAVELGIEVPYFFSGMHHNNNPAEYNGGKPLDDPTRPNPWISTEFWSIWFSNYGQAPSDNSEYGSAAATYRRRTWRILANGGNGYNFYMGHGGSNFGYTNADVGAASYDYGAPVGQTGDLRPTYYEFKKIALFATSFQEILENSSNDPEGAKDVAVNSAVNVLTRISPAGTIQFLDNAAKTTIETTAKAPKAMALPDSGTITLAPGELMPIVTNFELAPGVTLTWVPTRILGIAKQGKTTTLVLYGAPGTSAEAHVSGTMPLLAANGSTDLQLKSANQLALHATFADGEPHADTFTAGKNIIRILCMSDKMADRTWFVDAKDATYVVCGPSYVDEAVVTNGSLSLTAEQPWVTAKEADKPGIGTWVFGPGKTQILTATTDKTPTHTTNLSLGSWEVKSTMPNTTTKNAKSWMLGKEPLQMGSDGDLTADAWYQTSLQTSETGTYIIDFAVAADRLTVFLDGVRVAQDRAPRNSIVFDAGVGKHTLTIFTAHDGRPDFFPWLGQIETKYAKGLLGPALLSHLAVAPVAVSGWRVLKLPADPGEAALPPPSETAGFQDYKFGDSVFNHRPGFAWLETQIVANTDGDQRVSLHCDSVDTDGVVFLNGKKLEGHHGYQEPFEIPLANGTNTIAILVRNNYGLGGISPTTLVTRSGPALSVSDWLLRGGPGNPDAHDRWRTLVQSGSLTGPTFFRTTFTAELPQSVGAHPIWRVISVGLGHGSVWVNGHNLGRYPEKIPINGLYIPECWLVRGKNMLVIYDEDGRRPDQVTVSAEVGSSRDVLSLVSSR